MTLSHFSTEIDAVVGLMRTGELNAALAVSEELIQRFCSDPRSEAFWRYHLLRLEVLAYLGYSSRVASLLENELSGEPPTPELAVAVRVLRGSSYCRGACYRESKCTLDEAVEIASRAGCAGLEAEAHVRRGWLYHQLDRLPESERCYRLAIEIGRSLGDRYLEAIAMAGVAKNLMRNGKHRDAIDCLLTLRQTADELGERLFSAMLACEVARGYMNLHDYIPALNALLEAEPVIRDSGVMQLYGICEADIGCVHLKWGSYAIAISYLQRALTIAQEIGDAVSQRTWSRNLALAYAKLGDNVRSQSFAEAAALRDAGLAARRLEVD